MMLAYRFGSAVVDVETGEPGSGAWLSEFLQPWAEALTGGRGRSLVRMTASATACDAFDHGRDTASLRQVPCFALDSGVVVLPGWDQDGGTVIADMEFECYYRLTPGAVEVVARPGNRRARIGLMRVVREMLAAPALAGGGIADLHAAAFAVAGRAVLLAGAKGCGKTTMLIHALTSGSADFVANDRVFVDGRGHATDAVGLPTVVSIRHETLRVFPRLWKNGACQPVSASLGELARSGVAGGGAEAVASGLRLSPVQFARRLGAGVVRGGPIAAVVFPGIAPAAETWSFERMSPHEGAASLRACLYGTGTAPRVPTVFARAAVGAADPADQAGIVERVAARVPCVRGHMGLRTYHGSPAAWLRALSLPPEPSAQER